MIKKTNAIRLLDNAKIQYTLHEYQVDEAGLSGETVAIKIGADMDSVFKTLVARGASETVFVYCIPVSTELNLKKAAIAANEKKIEMVRVNELLDLTGYIRGGCSPLCMKKSFKTFFDETILIFENIYISAGVRGIQIRLSAEDLLKITGAKVADLV